MNTVTVMKDKLKQTLEENMKTHKADFEITWEAFRDKAIHNFEQRLKQVKHLEKGEHIDLYVNLTVPEDHTQDYVEALAMLEWEVEATVELTQNEFAQLVLDDWTWKRAFTASNMMYTHSVSPSTVRK